MTGHLLGAAGGVEAMFTRAGDPRQVAPPTINIDNQDPDCDLDYVPNTAREMKIDVALSNRSASAAPTARWSSAACRADARPSPA